MRFLVPISLFLTVFSINACKINSKNDVDEKQVEVFKSKDLKISALAPKNMIYLGEKETKPKVDLNLNNDSNDIIYNDDNGLFTTTGNGGIGVEFDEKNKRIPFSGIKLDIVKKELEIEPKIVLESEGVTKTANPDSCKEIFNLDLKNSLILIKKELIKGVTICRVKITASVIEDNKLLTDSGSFEVSLNKTYAGYLKEGNKTANYVKRYASINSNNIQEVLKKMSAYLNHESTKFLNLDYDVNKIANADDNLRDLDALTGVQSIVSLSAAKTNLNNLDAVMLLSNLEHLDISETKIESDTLSYLERMPNLKSLSVRNIDIKNLNNITKYLVNLESLDISDNIKLDTSSIDSLKNLRNLKKLKFRNIGLTNNLNMLTGLNQIISIDLSNNDLSKLTENDADILSNLFDLKEINLSNTSIPNNVLNRFFENISVRNTLEVFINRNAFDRNKDSNCDNIMQESDVRSLIKLTNLKYLDLHGNSCRKSDRGVISYAGLQSTNLFSGMKSLEALNISNTIVSDLSGISKLGIKNIILNELEKNKDGTLVINYSKGINLTANACKQYLGETEKACERLGKGSEKYVEYSAGEYSWTVPANVFKVTLTGASGANGGSGGGGSGSAAPSYMGSWGVMTFSGAGGAGGSANNQPGASGGAGMKCALDLQDIRAYAPSGSNGSAATVGGLTAFGDYKFPFGVEYVSTRNGNYRIGGKGGVGGVSVTPVSEAGCIRPVNEKMVQGGISGAGGNGINGWSAPVKTVDLSVNPGELITIQVGKGGIGSQGGAGGGLIGDWRAFYQKAGESGTSGQNGEDGFLRITYEEFK
ncbi:leucine-rich repeat domain-containing protein [Fluviispira sanaruensis]|uniref:Uncharacterized protein n=1 Tax=Fluviispira sanaruensis TaxID=2493639 RepID=A0A4P2VQW9_FLUSA|nr:leucine-rich repeat domain-containing protein [Fluviispira sanaruensis]BBH54624.1 hypothetical protein JCM31447_30980 [Fluviispira sanaruensis]